jgi:zinc-finger binding domain of transposase IS66
MTGKCGRCDLRSELELLREENKQLKEELQRLRLKIFGIKPSKKKRNDSDSDAEVRKTKKHGPPFGHEGRARKRPTRVDRRVLLRFESCPDCGGDLSELQEPRVRYTEDIAPAKLFVTEHIIKRGYWQPPRRSQFPSLHNLSALYNEPTLQQDGSATQRHLSGRRV